LYLAKKLAGVNLDFPSARNLLIDMTLPYESYNFVLSKLIIDVTNDIAA
jgi:hypothetical protein